jgi:hypothetical protein
MTPVSTTTPLAPASVRARSLAANALTLLVLSNALLSLIAYQHQTCLRQ